MSTLLEAKARSTLSTQHAALPVGLHATIDHVPMTVEQLMSTAGLHKGWTLGCGEVQNL